MKHSVSMAALVLAFAFLLGGCATSPATRTTSGSPLLVGITPDYPPLIYKQGNQVVGIEADLARRLGAAMNRPVRFVELAWDDLVPALLDSRIDIIMSGMSITDSRKVRIAFSGSYMRNNLVAIVAREDKMNYPDKDAILHCDKGVGVLRGSSADAFVAQNMPDAEMQYVDKTADVKNLFQFKRIRIFIGDIYAVAWLISENEASLTSLWIPLQGEEFGWGFRQDDVALRESVNRILAGWKQDGTLKSVLVARVPYLDRIQWEAP